MKIKRTIERVPGGMMLIPLLLGAIINTLFPNTATFFGSFTEAIFKGAAPLMAVNLFCIGVTMNFKATPTIVKKGGAILIAKVGIAALVGVVAAKFIGGGMIWGGLSVLAIIVAMNDTNGGMYISLMNQFGKKEDVGATTIMNLETGPFITMVTLGIAGLSTFPWQYMVGSILPLALGMVLGNLDSEIRDMFAKATPALIPFFAFGLGYGINLTKVYQAGLTGIFLGLAVIVITGTACFLADKLTGGSGLAGIASATTAGNAATVPALGGPDGLKPPNCPKKRPNWHSKGVLNERTISTAWPECDMFWKSEAFALCSRISTTTIGIRKSGNNSDRRICHTAALADNICST